MIQKSGRIRDKFSGFHHDYLGRLEKSKVIEVIKKKPLHTSGAYEGDIFWGNLEIEKKTFFPSSWTQEKVVEEIVYSLGNTIQKPLFNKNKWIFIGNSKEGLRIKTVITIDGYVIIAFPFYESSL